MVFEDIECLDEDAAVVAVAVVNGSRHEGEWNDERIDCKAASDTSVLDAA